MTEPTEQLRDFLAYVADHEKELKAIAAKAFPERGDILEELYQEAIIKAAGAIVRGTNVADQKSYFFIVYRSAHMSYLRNEKKRHDRGDRLWLDSHDIAQDHDRTAWQREKRDDALREILTLIAERYGEETATLYALNRIYPHRWSQKRISAGAGIDRKLVSAILKSVGKFVQTDKRVARIIRQLQDEIWDN